MSVNPRRVRQLNAAPYQSGPWIYWMSRDQRVNDNWALLYAAEQALRQQQPLAVIFCLNPRFLEASYRSFQFMIEGLNKVANELHTKHIPFYILEGETLDCLTKFVVEWKIGAVVTDFSPLHISRLWKQQLCDSVNIPIFEVDAHNIVPVWQASQKLEFSARTLRPKLTKQLAEFLEPFPTLATWPIPWPWPNPRWQVKKVLSSVMATKVGPELPEMISGSQAAHTQLQHFLANKLAIYATQRNNPLAEAQSQLSPYLHFGQLAAQRVVLELNKTHESKLAKETFAEEIIIRRELADNFCFYQLKYDQIEGFPAWAQQTLTEHVHDSRPYLYELADLEAGQTHDRLWNATQLAMGKTGKLHGYLRMYWAKKILEWTPDAATALKYAIYLNDRYELDGRDPNGYTGIAWAIGGVHDRPWFRRPIFGLIRYMSYSGMVKKFDVDAYCQYVSRL